MIRCHDYHREVITTIRRCLERRDATQYAPVRQGPKCLFEMSPIVQQMAETFGIRGVSIDRAYLATHSTSLFHRKAPYIFRHCQAEHQKRFWREYACNERVPACSREINGFQGLGPSSRVHRLHLLLAARRDDPCAID